MACHHNSPARLPTSFCRCSYPFRSHPCLLLPTSLPAYLLSSQGFKLKVKVSPWINRKSVLLQFVGLRIDDPSVRVELDKVDYLGLWAPVGGNARERRLGSHHRDAYVDGRTDLSSGVVLALDDHNHGLFEIRVRYERGSFNALRRHLSDHRLSGRALGSFIMTSFDVRLTCLAAPTTPFPPPQRLAIPPSPPTPPAPPGLPPSPPMPPRLPGADSGIVGGGPLCVRDSANGGRNVCCLGSGSLSILACAALDAGELPRCAAGIATDCQYSSAAACGGDAMCPSSGLIELPGNGEALTAQSEVSAA